MSRSGAAAKSNRPVIEVLRSKHPGLRVPDVDRDGQTAFEAYDSCPEVIPQVISAEAIERTAAKLSAFRVLRISHATGNPLLPFATPRNVECALMFLSL